MTQNSRPVKSGYIADAKHASAALEMQINKTDQNDAEGVAQIVRTGWYRSVHVKSLTIGKCRSALGARYIEASDHI